MSKTPDTCLHCVVWEAIKRHKDGDPEFTDEDLGHVATVLAELVACEPHRAMRRKVLKQLHREMGRHTEDTVRQRVANEPEFARMVMLANAPQGRG